MNTEFEKLDSPPDILYTQPGGKTDASPVKQDHVYEDFKASQAIQGLPAGEMADKISFLEKEWNDFTADHPNLVCTTAEGIRILRLQIRELALGYAAEMNRRQATAIQRDIAADYIRTQQMQAEFRKFLAQHFEQDIEAGVARNLTVFQVAQDVLLRGKPRWFEFWRR